MGPAWILHPQSQAVPLELALSWHTQVLPSILHSHKILQLQMTRHATMCLAVPVAAGVLVVTCQLPPLCSFTSLPLSLIDYLSKARLKLNPRVSLL